MANENAANIRRNDLCRCGSGRTYSRCCGHPKRRKLQSLLQQGIGELQAGRAAPAVAKFRHAIKADPGFAQAHYLLGIGYLEMGQFQHASTAIGRALQLGLADPAAFFHHGRALLLAGNADDAIRQLEKAIEAKPDFPEAIEILANILYELGRHDRAEELYRRAIALRPDQWKLHHNLAHTLYQQLRYGEAVESLDRVLELVDRKADALATQALLLELDNRLDAARAKVDMALREQKDHAVALLVLAKLQRRDGRSRDALYTLENMTDKNADGHAVSYWNEYGRLLDAAGRYGEAFNAFERSKAALSETARERFHLDHWEAALSAAEDAAHKAALRQSPVGAMEDEPDPVFILGFHRTGTTLLESMLSRHSRISAAGETLLLSETEARFQESFGQSLGNVLVNSPEELPDAGKWASDFTDTLRRRAGGWTSGQVITEKSPLNSAHILLLRWLFPRARIIRMVRHPADTVLSCYFENFRSGNEWSHNLVDAARLYARLHEHLGRMLPAVGSPVLDVRYETLVGSPEQELRAILDFMELPWEPGCLNFHVRPQAAKTASYAQVARPLYSSSIKRHTHYAEFIGEDVAAILYPAVTDLGYDIINSVGSGR